MRIAKMLSTIASAALCCAASASTYREPALGSLLPPPPAPLAQSYEVTRGMAACVMKNDEPHALVFIDAVGSSAITAAIKPLNAAMSSCLGSGGLTLKAKPHGLQAFFAEAALRQTTLPVLPIIPKQETYSIKWLSSDLAQASLEEMAICLADTHPHEVEIFISSDPSSSSEKVALDDLTSFLKPCVPPSAKLTTDRMGLRLALSAALYHRVFDPASGMVGTPASVGKN